MQGGLVVATAMMLTLAVFAGAACGGDDDAGSADTGTQLPSATRTAVSSTDADAEQRDEVSGGGGGGNNRALPPPALSESDLPDGWEIARAEALNFDPPRRGGSDGRLGEQEQALRDLYGSSLQDGLYQRLRTESPEGLPTTADIEILAFAGEEEANQALAASQQPADLTAGEALDWQPEGGSPALSRLTDPTKPEQTIYRASLLVGRVLVVVTLRSDNPETGPEAATDLAVRVYDRIPPPLRQ
jgi:hypothetical protein